MRPVGNFENVLEAARDWTRRMHAEQNQTWGDGRPYSVHLAAVESVLLRFGLSDPTNPIHQNLRLAALAHGLLKKTPVRPETIRALLGPDVLELVQGLTESPWATVLKLSVRIAAIEDPPQWLIPHQRDACQEVSEGLFEPLIQPGTPAEHLWEHLTSLRASAGSQDPPEPTPAAPQPPEPVSTEPAAAAPLALPVPPCAVAILPEPWF